MNELEQLQAAFELAKSKGDKVMAMNFAEQIVAIEAQGVQQQAAPEVDQSGNITDPLLKGATMGLSDEIQGGIGAIYKKFSDMLDPNSVSGITGEGPSSFSEDYGTARDSVRNDTEAFKTRNPNTALAAEIGGTLMSGGIGGAKLLGSQAIKRAPTLLKAAATPATYGAESALYGFGEGEGMEDSLDKAWKQGLTGAVAGPVTNKLLKTGGNIVARPFAKKVREAGQKSTTLKKLKEGYKAAYKIVDESGVQISESAYKPFKEFVKRELIKDVGKTKYVGRIKGAYDELMSLKNPTIKELSGVRHMLQVAKKGDPTQQFQANKIDKEITDYIKYLSPVDVIKGADKIDGLGKMLKKGDELFNRHAQGTTLNKMTEKAKRVKGGIGDDALSSQARTFLNSEKKTIGMDSKILTKLDDMIEGDPMKKIMRVGAQMKPSSASARGAVPTMISSIGGLSVGGPLGLAIAIAPSTLGAAFQGIVNQMTKSEFKRIQHAAINKGQRAIEDIMEEMTAKYAKGATAATLAATPQIEELSNEATSLYKMMTD